MNKLTAEQKQERADAREAARAAARIAAEKAQKPVKRLTISIEWKKSRTWGNNPSADGAVEYADGTFARIGPAKASGCGYDKESTVVAELFNACLKYKLWGMTHEQIKGGHGSGDKGPAPYGINSYQDGGRHYAGGVGIGCYYKIGEYIGGTFEHTASGRLFDVYTWTAKEA